MSRNQEGDWSWRRLFVPRESGSRVANSLACELLGTLFFQFMAGVITTRASTGEAALGVGLTYAVLVFITKPVSGGHLNPAISLAGALSVHYHWITALGYIVVQVIGAALGAALQALLVPGVHLGDKHGPGCFYGTAHLGWPALLGWEAVMTFLVVAAAYACLFKQRQHAYAGTGPLAVGLAVAAVGLTGGAYTGAFANPARVLAPAIVFVCGWGRLWTYVLAQLLGAALAASFCGAVFGAGEAYLDGDEGEGRGRSAPELLGEGVRGGAGVREPLLPTVGAPAGVAEPPRPAYVVD